TVNVVVVALVIACETFSVKFCVAVRVPRVAVSTSGKLFTAVAMPLKVPGPVPLSFKVTPAGSAPAAGRLGAGEPGGVAGEGVGWVDAEGGGGRVCEERARTGGSDGDLERLCHRSRRDGDRSHAGDRRRAGDRGGAVAVVGEVEPGRQRAGLLDRDGREAS